MNNMCNKFIKKLNEQHMYQIEKIRKKSHLKSKLRKNVNK